jgi:hypothetical protein
MPVTGLTSVVSVLLELLVPLCSRVGLSVLVPSTSSTPVATWSWPTWAVESEKCFGQAVFDLLEKPSPSRRIFIDSHSLPPLRSPVRSFREIATHRCIHNRYPPLRQLSNATFCCVHITSTTDGLVARGAGKGAVRSCASPAPPRHCKPPAPFPSGLTTTPRRGWRRRRQGRRRKGRGCRLWRPGAVEAGHHCPTSSPAAGRNGGTGQGSGRQEEVG